MGLWQKITDLDIPVLGIALKRIRGVATGVAGHTHTDSPNASMTVRFVDGSTETIRFRDPKDGEDGEDGVSVESVSIVNKHLIVKLDNGKSIDAGEIAADSKDAVLSENFTSTVAIGQVKNGTRYAKGTPLENIIKDILTNKVPPSVTFTITPAKTLYDVVTETLSKLTFTIRVVKGTNDIRSAKLYINDTMYKEWTSFPGGSADFTYDHTFVPATKTDPLNLRIEVDDIEGMKGQATNTIRFVAKSYYGWVDANVAEPEEAEIKVLQNNTLKTEKGLTYRGFTYAWGRVCYAYPKSFGALTRIMDEKNNINYTDSFTRREVAVDGMAYYCYTINNPAGANNNELTFS